MAPPTASTDAPLSRPVSPRLWKACVGDAVAAAAGFPAVGSIVLYFPQGHAEQASSPVDPSAFVTHRPVHRCLVTAVDLLSDPETSEVLSRIHLAPVPVGDAPSPELLSRCRPGVALNASGVDEDGFLSSGKVLTPSDAHNGGGFSVPKICADTLFPPLDYEADPPAQRLRMRDLQGDPWEFRHIYRGKPPRHLLTSGWSNFVDRKSLVAGDAVIFMRSADEELFIGVRPKPSRGRIPPSSVVDAMTAANMDMPFEVLYYPRAGSPEFVVPEERVNQAMGIQWKVGMRIRYSIPNRVDGAQGSVVAVNPLFSSSPWRMLQVVWDDEEVLKDKNVCPWQVEPVSVSLHEQSGRTFSIGIQEARHDFNCVSSLTNLNPIDTTLISSEDSFIETPVTNYVGTVVDSGNMLQSRDSSLSSQESIRGMNMNMEADKPSGECFKLFGHNIQIKQPVDEDTNEMQGSKDDS